MELNEKIQDESEEEFEEESNKKRYDELDEKKIREYYHLPALQASSQLGICDTLFKKKCRSLKVYRWPYRKISSIKNIIRLIKKECPTTEKMINEKENKLKLFESHIEYIYDHPNINLSDIVPKRVLQYYSKIKRIEEKNQELITLIHKIDAKKKKLALEANITEMEPISISKQKPLEPNFKVSNETYPPDHNPTKTLEYLALCGKRKYDKVFQEEFKKYKENIPCSLEY